MTTVNAHQDIAVTIPGEGSVKAEELPISGAIAEVSAMGHLHKRMGAVRIDEA